MNTRVKTTLFHISQLLLIIAILASGMPVKAEGIADQDTNTAALHR